MPLNFPAIEPTFPIDSAKRSAILAVVADAKCKQLFFSGTVEGFVHNHGSNSRPDKTRTIWNLALISILVSTIQAHEIHGYTISQSGKIIPPTAREKERPLQAAPFAAFAPKVTTRWDDNFLYVESNGLPSHNVMGGITNWQQQVPLPHPYTGDNAWRIPLHPVVAAEPASIKGRFLRGAIALAVNGIPIFNPQNNRGEISQEIGELDQWGGHCGRADDYHYHAAPLHLEKTVGKGMPIAYALDGYPLYGLAEPDGSALKPLDSCHGHDDPKFGYHYHASGKYPYVNGGFHGTVVEANGQVDPQPAAGGVRGAGTPLRGAKITSFEATAASTFKLGYELNGEKRAIVYSVNADGTYPFEYQNGKAGVTKETYSAGKQRRPEGRPPQRQEQGRESERPPSRDVPSKTIDNAATNEGTLKLGSPVIAEDGALPVEFTGDGAGVSPPLSWTGAPGGTKSYALIMHHLDPEGQTKIYWTLYNIPANCSGLEKNSKGIGLTGKNTIHNNDGYAPPHSKGPGKKTYTISLYALSATPQINAPAGGTTAETLLAAIKDITLARADLQVNYTRVNDSAAEKAPAPKPAPPQGPAGGTVKPALADTIKVNVYADNWFMMYLNGKLAAVDSIDFLPHNVVTVDILPEYPLTIAILAKDNADPKTGMEYGNHIGDAGFIIKFADGTVSNASWKAKSFFKGPLNRDTANPKVEHTAVPENWNAVNFDDSKWPQAVEYTEQRVNPKEAFFKAYFAGAKFIWTADLDLDNSVIFRTRIEKPGWKKTWTTHPDLDVTSDMPK